MATETIEKKICIACKKELPISNFYFRSDKGVYRGCCKKCKRLTTKDEIKERMKSDSKICKHCGIDKPVSEYQKAGGGKWLQPYCKPCDAERKRIYELENKEKVIESRKKYYKENKELINEKAKQYVSKNITVVKQRRKIYREKNKDKIIQKGREYLKKNGDAINKKSREKRASNPEYYRAKWAKKRLGRTQDEIEKRRSNQREWRKKNIDKIKVYKNSPVAKEKRRIYNKEHSRKRNATDISYKIVKNLRSRIGFALKRNIRKSETTKKLLGCSVDFFKEYFQSLFTEGMTWNDFMNGDIHIDHKKPCKEFDLTNTEEQTLCFNYKNLQPLWWYDNLKKGASYQEQKTA